MKHAAAKPRKRLPKAHRRAEILRAATEEFHISGYEAASLHAIAGRLKINKAGLYCYFRSKEELLTVLIEGILEKGIANIDAIAASGGDPLTFLWMLVAGHVRHQCENLVETSVYLHERRWLSSTRRPALLSKESYYQSVFERAIREGQEQELIRSEIDPELAAQSILGSTNWIYTWYRPNGDLVPEIIGSHFAAMTVNSLAEENVLKSWAPPRLPKRSKSGGKAGAVSLNAFTGFR